MSSVIMGCGGIFWDVVGYGEAWWDVVGLVRYSGIFSRIFGMCWDGLRRDGMCMDVLGGGNAKGGEM
jgi:hypothetical protein